MASDLSVNPVKSFRFVAAVKELATRSTVSQPEIRQSASLESVSPQDLRNEKRKSSFQVQSRITPQERLIDIIV